MTSADLNTHYAAMWEHAWPAIASGAIEVDASVMAGADPRRGLTLIVRPAPAVRAHFDALLDRLVEEEPGQYRYPAPDMHLTILSLFTATADHAAPLARLDDYRAVVRAALEGIAPFAIRFDGLTLSRGAVLARGVPDGPALATLRDRLRDGLRAQGLDASVDQRYRLVTAHATLLRFAAPLAHPARFRALLEALRDIPLGSMEVAQVELVINDWYMSHNTLQQVAVLALTGWAPVSLPDGCSGVRLGQPGKVACASHSLPAMKAAPMYGLIGKIRTQPGSRDALAALLLKATQAMPGCLSYIVASDPTDADALWITEVWDSAASHKASLALPAIQAALTAARPMIAGFGERFETAPLGGHGLY